MVFLTPTSSTSILSSPTGPRDVFTMFASDWAANTWGGRGEGGDRSIRKRRGRRKEIREEGGGGRR